MAAEDIAFRTEPAVVLCRARGDSPIYYSPHKSWDLAEHVMQAAITSGVFKAALGLPVLRAVQTGPGTEWVIVPGTVFEKTVMMSDLFPQNPYGQDDLPKSASGCARSLI